MELLKKHNELLQYLKEWQNNWHIYDFETIHNLSITDFENSDYLEGDFDYDLSPFFTDKFVTFGIDGAGGRFAFWIYPNLSIDAPIVMLDSEGGFKILASNLNDFVNRMINDISFCAGWICEGDEVQEAIKDVYPDLLDKYEDEKGERLSEEKLKMKLDQERDLFKNGAMQLVKPVTEKVIQININSHPSFSSFVNKLTVKNLELMILKRSIGNESEIGELLSGFDKELNTAYPYCTKDEIIKGFKANYPDYYMSKAFQTWI